MCYTCINHKVSWQGATTSCQQSGASLVTVSNSTIQAFLGNLCTEDGNIWIGLNDRTNEGAFVWVENSAAISYSNWHTNQPDDAGDGEDCVHLIPSTHKWNDINCAANFSFICQAPQDDCFSSPCIQGTCIDQLRSYTCQCQPGYTGTNCEIDVDECQSSPCIHGNCSDLVNEFKCQCFPGYEGTQCQIDTDECLSSPCRHGTCIDQINSYTCNCSPGYTGRECETEINECQTSPCGNGLCKDKVNSYVCECSFGYTGLYCDIFNTNKRLKHNNVAENIEIFVFPDVLQGESKPRLSFFQNIN
uniref:Fibropellin-1 n=1 Tax=Magallana gigas TaxID=29159 RepID=A0A8W8K3F6_MAGGI